MKDMIPDKRYEKFNGKHGAWLHFTEEGIANLEEYYRELRGLPRYIDDVLALSPHSPKLDYFAQNPALLQWADDGSFIIQPNIPVMDMDAFMADTDNARNHPDGLELTMWYIHPRMLENSVFQEKYFRDNFLEAADSFSYVPYLNSATNLERREEKERIKDIERESAITYLASTLDLSEGDLPYLRKVRDAIHAHLREVYHVQDSDEVKIFSHDLIGESGTTLHFHIRVNQGIHPLEKQHSTSLDEIIENLEKGITPKDLLLARKKIFFSPDGMHKRKNFQHIDGISFEEAESPFTMTSRCISENSSTERGSWRARVTGKASGAENPRIGRSAEGEGRAA